MMTPTFTAVFCFTFVVVPVCAAEETLDVLVVVIDEVGDEDVGVVFPDCDVGALICDEVVEDEDVVVVVCDAMLDLGRADLDTAMENIRISPG